MEYEEISLRYDIPVSVLTKRVFILGIKPISRKRKVTFSQEQVQKILEYNPKGFLERWSKKTHPRKIKIVETYLELGVSIRKTSIYLNIHRDIVQKIIKEYKQTGYVVVASKMNEI